MVSELVLLELRSTPRSGVGALLRCTWSLRVSLQRTLVEWLAMETPLPTTIVQPLVGRRWVRRRRTYARGCGYAEVATSHETPPPTSGRTGAQIGWDTGRVVLSTHH
jgi:hypothetical protein